MNKIILLIKGDEGNPDKLPYENENETCAYEHFIKQVQDSDQPNKSIPKFESKPQSGFLKQIIEALIGHKFSR